MPARLDIDGPVTGAVDNQRWYANGRQHRPDVDLVVHARYSHGGTGTGTHPQVGRPPSNELLIPRQAWSSPLQVTGRPVEAAPGTLNQGEMTSALVLAGTPRIVPRGQPARKRTQQHQRGCRVDVERRGVGEVIGSRPGHRRCGTQVVRTTVVPGECRAATAVEAWR